MEISKRILVACGTAIATSTVVAKAIEEALKERGINATIRQCKAAEVKSLVGDADLVVTTTPVPSDLGVPVIQTLAFLTGIGREAVIEQIVEALKDKKLRQQANSYNVSYARKHFSQKINMDKIYKRIMEIM